MRRRLLVGTTVLLAVAALPAGASAASSPPKLPEVKKLAPVELKVGEVLTIEGKHFVHGKLRNQVVFSRAGIRPVFALSYSADKDTIKVRLPAKLLPYLERRDGRPVPTRFAVTVLSQRLNPRFTAGSESPLIGAPLASAGVPGAADCDGDGVAETARQDILGLLVVGLRLVGVRVPDPALRDPAATASQALPPGTPSVPGVPGAADVDVPDSVPAESVARPAAPVVCPSAAPPGGQQGDDD